MRRRLVGGRGAPRTPAATCERAWPARRAARPGPARRRLGSALSGRLLSASRVRFARNAPWRPLSHFPLAPFLLGVPRPRGGVSARPRGGPECRWKVLSLPVPRRELQGKARLAGGGGGV